MTTSATINNVFLAAIFIGGVFLGVAALRSRARIGARDQLPNPTLRDRFGSFSRTTQVLVVGLVVGSVVTGGAAFAAGNINNKVTGCLDSSGSLTNVAVGRSPSSSCSAQETQITWNKKGRRGKVGATGAAGATGAQGEQGPQGPQGIRGPVGPEGETGERGRAGAQGATGNDAPAGATGSAKTTGTVPQIKGDTTDDVITRQFEAPSDGFVTITGSYHHRPNIFVPDDEVFDLIVRTGIAFNSTCGIDQVATTTTRYIDFGRHREFIQTTVAVRAGVNVVALCTKAELVRPNDEPNWRHGVLDGSISITFTPNELELREVGGR